jgi:hypothetical protein
MATDAAASTGAVAAAQGAATRPASAAQDVLLQYVVMRRDLWTDLGWPLGSVVAQACHATAAALWESRDSLDTCTYCAPENLDHMHKVRWAIFFFFFFF